MAESMTSLEKEEDLTRQWFFLNELVKETQRQNDRQEEADVRNLRTIWFFNNDFSNNYIFTKIKSNC